MKRNKPERGLSFLIGISSIGAAIFGVFWTITTLSIGAPFFFPLFGVVFITIAVAQAFNYFRNPTAVTRFSLFTLLGRNKEKDQPDSFPSHKEDRYARDVTSSGLEPGNFCPYCGFNTEPDHLYCKQCGRKLFWQGGDL